MTPQTPAAEGWTAGPWFVDDDQGGGDIRVVGHPVWPCTRFGEKGVWDVAHLEVLFEYPDEQAANARLIAAAPDLFEALDNCAKVLAHHGVGPSSFRQAEAALAKARGQ